MQGTVVDSCKPPLGIHFPNAGASIGEIDVSSWIDFKTGARVRGKGTRYESS